MIELAHVIVIGSAGGTSWTGILLAVLGSSALGAVAGGYLTTRLRGGIERDEAWRTRLIDAADSFLTQLSRSVNAIPYSWLAGIENGDEALTNDDDIRTPRALEIAVEFEEERRQLIPLLSRVELLFGAEASEAATEAVRIVDNAGDVFTGKSWIAREMSATDGARALGVLTVDPMSSSDFDLDDYSSIATLTRQLLESVAQQQKKLLDLCTQQIRADHPGELLVGPKGKSQA